MDKICIGVIRTSHLKRANIMIEHTRDGASVTNVEYRWGWRRRFSASSIISEIVLLLLFVVCKCVHALGGGPNGRQ